MVCVQRRLRLAMQHVYGHTGNLGNECADHAAALGSFGLLSSHKNATRWDRHNFDTSACCGDCNSVSEVLEKCIALELKLHRYVLCSSSGSLRLTRTHLHHLWVCSQAFLPSHPFCSSGQAMESPTSSVFTASSSGENFEHNM